MNAVILQSADLPEKVEYGRGAELASRQLAIGRIIRPQLDEINQPQGECPIEARTDNSLISAFHELSVHLHRE